MKGKQLYFFVIILSMVIGLSVSNAAAGPAIVVPIDQYDFGKAVEGDEVEHDFMIRNAGDDELEIAQVKAGCSCTAASYSKKISAGGVGNVNIKFFTSGYGGRSVIKTAEIFSNDPDHPRVVLRISGAVEQLFSVTPRWVRMVGAVGDPLKSVVRIVSLQDDDFKILDVGAQDGENIRYHLEKDSKAKKPTYVLTVENLKKNKGWYSDVVCLKTSSERQPKIEIKVNGNILDPRSHMRN